LKGTVRERGLLSVPPVVRNTVAVVAALGACLAALSVAVLVYRYEIDPAPHRYLMHLFNLDDEGGFQAWYQSSLLLACAVLLGAIAVRRRRVRARFALHWAALSAIFVALSVDEAVSLHEQGIEPLRDALDAGGLLYFTWVLPAAGVLVFLAAVYSRFLVHLPPRILRIFLVAAALYVVGALGIEALGGLYADQQGRNQLAYGLIANVEEVLEIAGVLAFGAALGTYLIEYAGEASVERMRTPVTAAPPSPRAEGGGEAPGSSPTPGPVGS
jgi:hypothetical protein